MIMKRFTWPAELTLNLIGGKWKALILHHLLQGESRRFGELKRLLPGISAKMLAKHLKELEFDGLITRMELGDVRVRIVYTPTNRSRSLAPILEAIQTWGRAHMEDYGDNRPPTPGDARRETPVATPSAPPTSSARPAGPSAGHQALRETRPLAESAFARGPGALPLG